MTDRKHPLLKYLGFREWEWIPATKIVADTGCAIDDIESILSTPSYYGSIETRGNIGCLEYRYIGSIHACMRTVIEYLRSEYPSWKSVSQIMSATECHANIKQALSRYCDLLPVTIRRIRTYGARNPHNEYQYLPNDPRSLISTRSMMTYVQRRHASITNRENVLNALKRHNGDWVSPDIIAHELGLKSRMNVNPSLRHLRDSFGVAESRIDSDTQSLVYRYIGEADA